MRPKRSAKPKLGRLKKIHPADYWQNAADFCQWLAEADNLELLGEALGFDLDLQVAPGRRRVRSVMPVCWGAIAPPQRQC
jgi:hypothetical protein